MEFLFKKDFKWTKVSQKVHSGAGAYLRGDFGVNTPSLTDFINLLGLFSEIIPKNLKICRPYKKNKTLIRKISGYVSGKYPKTSQSFKSSRYLLLPLKLALPFNLSFNKLKI